MPKFPLLPHVTILVPVGSDLAAFETSLVSVLENRPADAEVIVPHDGSYDDPFDLQDEVRFVRADSSRVGDLIAAGAAEARARFVHVLADGVRATSEWLTAGVRPFDDPHVGSVSPLVVTADGSRAIVGWRDYAASTCQPVVTDGSPRQGRAASDVAAYLAASFWRRETLRSLRGCYRGDCLLEASYLYGCLARRAGWRIASTADCRLTTERAVFPNGISGFRQGQRLGAMRHLLARERAGAAMARAARGLLAAAWGRLPLGEAAGQACLLLAAGDVAASFRIDPVWPDDRRPTLPMGGDSPRRSSKAA